MQFLIYFSLSLLPSLLLHRAKSQVHEGTTAEEGTLKHLVKIDVKFRYVDNGVHGEETFEGRNHCKLQLGPGCSLGRERVRMTQRQNDTVVK